MRSTFLVMTACVDYTAICVMREECQRHAGPPDPKSPNMSSVTDNTTSLSRPWTGRDGVRALASILNQMPACEAPRSVRLAWTATGFGAIRYEEIMIELAIGALVIGVIASLLGFTTIAGASFAIAKVIGVIFLVVFLVLMVAALAVF